MALTGGARDYGGAAVFGRGSVASRQASFFDREAIIKLMDKTTHKVLSKFGAFTRQRARTSLRYKEGISAPGSPPHAHKTMTRNKTNKQGVTKRTSSSPLRDFTYFSYDRGAKSVIIGPAKTNQVFFDRHRKPVTGTVPEVLEYGGEITILEWLRAGQWQRADLRSRRRLAERPTRYRTVTIRARPWMGPAFEAELPQLMKFWQDAAL